VIGVVLISNLRLVEAPGNVLICARVRPPQTPSPTVSQVVTLDRDFLLEPVGKLGAKSLRHVEDGLPLLLHL
jgi:hypothetical protein